MVTVTKCPSHPNGYRCNHQRRNRQQQCLERDQEHAVYVGVHLKVLFCSHVGTSGYAKRVLIHWLTTPKKHQGRQQQRPKKIYVLYVRFRAVQFLQAHVLIKYSIRKIFTFNMFTFYFVLFSTLFTCDNDMKK